MEAKTILEPLVMLINGKYVIHACSPESPQMEAIGLMLLDKVWFVHSKIRYDDAPAQ
jgi:hypothetical protein